MKVLVAHNRYRSSSPSGENRVVDEEIELLRAGGVEVVPFIDTSDRTEDGLGRLAEAAVGPVYAPGGVLRFKQALAFEKPDIVHIHNLFPFISPWVIRTARAAGIPVVMTMHNYRLDCVKGTRFRAGQLCSECVGKAFPYPAIRHGCYRESRLQSVPMAMGQVWHRSTWRLISHYCVLTEFMAQELLRPREITPQRVTIRPTWCHDTGWSPGPRDRASLFVGRLDHEKGIETLLRAWSSSKLASAGWQLRVVGTGPLEAQVRALAASDARIDYVGQLTGEALVREFRRAAFLAVPSCWYEGFPRVISEALAVGTPVAVSALGSLGSIVESAIGWKFDPTPKGWRDGLDSLDEAATISRQFAARAYWEDRLSPRVAFESLLDIYNAACAERFRDQRDAVKTDRYGGRRG